MFHLKESKSNKKRRKIERRKMKAIELKVEKYFFVMTRVDFCS